MTSSSIMLMVSNNYNDSDVESIHNNNNNGGGGSPMVVDEMIVVPSTPPFQIDERVYYASKKGDEDNNNNSNISDNNDVEYFEAIVRQSQYITSTDGWKFFLHFVGWNSRWDRWVDTNSIMKDTANTRRKMQQQQSKLSSTTNNNNNNSNNNNSNNNSNKRRTAMSNDSKEVSSVSSQRPSKRSKGGSSKNDGVFTSDSLIYSDYCELPLTLKTVLIDEYEKITRKGYHSPHGYDDVADSSGTSLFTKPPRMVHVLPAPVTARKVVEHFEKKKMKEIEKYNNNNNNDATIIITNDDTDHNNDFSKQQQQKQKVTSDQIHTFCDGLIELFEQAIPTCLLYPQERPQYEYIARKLQQKESDPMKRQRLVDIYGCEYLLRLIVRLPILLQPIGEAALAVSMSLSSTSPVNNGTTTTLQSSSSTSSSSSVTKFEMHDPMIIGPFITELLVLMQKNRQSLFKVTGNFRFPIQGKEWMDYEEKIFCNNNNASMKHSKK